MGGVEGKQGAWAYPEGGKMVSPSHNTFMLNWWVLGMGAVSSAMAKSAVEKGVTIFTDQVRLYWNICFSWSISDMKNEMTFNKFFFFFKTVKEIMVDDNGSVAGVRLDDETEVLSKVVLSNATPQVTFVDLLASGTLPESYLNKVKSVDYTSPVTKINGLRWFDILLNSLLCPKYLLFSHL